MKMDFDSLPDRSHTGALKWDRRTDAEKAHGIVPLSVADMEFSCAPAIRQAVQQAAAHGLYGYTDPEETYFAAVLNWMRDRHGFCAEKEQIVCENGVIPAISTGLRALTNPGEGVIVFTPVYYPFAQVVRLNDRRLVTCALHNEKGRYTIDFDALEEAAKQPQNTLLLLCSPHNPVGRVWTRAELERLSQICLRHRVRVISDEIHFDLTPNGTHTVLSTISPEMARSTIVCTAVSKSFNLAGLRLANLFIADEQMRASYLKRQEADGNSNIAYFGRAATIAAYTQCADWLEELNAYLRGNFACFEDFFARNFPEITVTPLEGTYLAWADFRAWHKSDEELSAAMRQQCELVLDDGFIFGSEGSGFERFNIALPRAELQKALQRLTRLQDWRK